MYRRELLREFVEQTDFVIIGMCALCNAMWSRAFPMRRRWIMSSTAPGIPAAPKCT